MPVYTFRCRNCETRFERELSIKTVENMQALGYNANPRCTTCHSSNVVRIIVAAPVVAYKDEGFTLYKGDKDD